MPVEIMNQSLYEDRTVQDWHRYSLPRDHDAIDLDLMGVCRYSWCRDPLYLIESTTRRDKPATILRRLAEKTGSFGIVVVHDTDAITSFRVVFDPDGMESREIASGDVSGVLAAFLTEIRDRHGVAHDRGLV